MPDPTAHDFCFPRPVGAYLLVAPLNSPGPAYEVLDAAPSGQYRAGDVVLLDGTDPMGPPWAVALTQGDVTAAYVHADRVVAVVAHAGAPTPEEAQRDLWNAARALAGTGPAQALRAVAGVVEALVDVARDAGVADADLSEALGAVAGAIGCPWPPGDAPSEADTVAAMEAGRAAMEQAARVVAALPALDAVAAALDDAMTVANRAKTQRGTAVGASLQAEADGHVARARGDLLRVSRELASILGTRVAG